MNLDPQSFKGLSRFLAPSAGGPLADRALQEGLISAAQLQECADEQDRSGRPLDEILVEKGYLKADDAVRLRHPALPPEVVKAAQDPASVFNHYVLVERAGSGGMAEVWRAWDRSLGRWVAVKLLKHDVGHPTQRIEREGRMAGQLSHPAIVPIFERGQRDGRPYLVMPFVEGKSPVPPLPERDAVRIALEVAGALAHAHAAGVLHRDVKPSNILLDAAGRPLLADFGLAIPANSGASRWAVSGTPEYASPEQIRGDVLDERTDVYSLGATLYHLLTGRPPFSGRDPQHIAERVLNAPPPPAPGVPSGLLRVVRRAMERDRERRYARVAELEAELRRYAESRDPARGQSRRVLVGVLLASLIPWAVMGGVLLRLRSEEKLQAARFALDEARRALSAVEGLRAAFGASAAPIADAAARAEAFLRGAAEEPSLGADCAAIRGRLREIAGREAEAEEDYRAAGAHPAARLGLARLATRRWREGKGGAADVAAAVGDEPGPAAVLKAFVEARWAEVLRLGTPLAATWSHDDVFLGALGRAAAELGRGEEALKRVDAALRLRPDDPGLLVDRALALRASRDEAGARALLEGLGSRLPPGGPLEARAKAILSGPGPR